MLLIVVVLFAAVLALANADCFSGEKFVQNILANEKLVSLGSTSQIPRFYYMCNNNILNINNSRALSIWNPNVNILCGKNGKRENNCTFTNGDFHIVVGSEFVEYAHTSTRIDNFTIQGFQFTRALEGNILSNNAMGVSMTIKDCIFLNNKAPSIINFFSKNYSYLTIEDSSFRGNTLLSKISHKYNGIIKITDEAILNVSNSSFARNILQEQDSETALIFYGGRNPEFRSVVNIFDSVFNQNEGMTNSLVSGDYLSRNFSSSNNFESGNIFIEKIRWKVCSGIKGDILDTNKWKSCLVRFETSSPPSLSPQPSIQPSLSKKPSISFAPTRIKRDCWREKFTQKVMAAERKVTDTSIPRTYKMCSNSIATIANYNYETFTFEDNALKALSIWNPNVIILCGDDGNSANNCTFTGGTFQIEIYPDDLADSNNVSLSLENILVQGITFTNVSEENIILYGNNDGEDINMDVTINDCLFHDNKAIAMIGMYVNNTGSVLYVENSSFRNNHLIQNLRHHSNSGMINVEYGASIHITTSNFIDNEFDKSQSPTALVIFGEYPETRLKTFLGIYNSSFVRNEGISSLAYGWFQSQDHVISSDNFEYGNIFAKKKHCSGIEAKILGEEERCFVLFDTHSSSPSLSIEPTTSPTLTSSPTISRKPTNPIKSCWGKQFTRKVMAAEENVIDVSVHRVYRMCQNSIAHIATYDYANGLFNGKGQKGLSLWNPNISILCGFVGDSSKNCTFSGGTFHIEIFSANSLDKKYNTTTLENITIQGITFTDVSESNIIVYGITVKHKEIGTSLLIKDCIFRENEAISLIDVVDNKGTHLYVEDTSFQGNSLISNDKFPNMGLIYTEKGGVISILRTEFIGNDLNVNKDSVGIRALVYFGGFPLPEYETLLDLQSSSFIQNKGMTDALVVGGFLYDDGYILSNNYEAGNIFTELDRNLHCLGVLRIRRANDTAFEQCINRFATSSSPASITYPSLIPTSVPPTVSSRPSESCWSSNFTNRVMDAEEFVTDASIPRKYIMCNHEIAKINVYHYNNATFSDEKGKMNALHIWNSNVYIVCGMNINDNNCTFAGGTFQIEIGSLYSPIKNVKIQGFKFINVLDTNILVHGVNVEKRGLSTYGASVLVKDCSFLENRATTMIWLYENYNTHLTIEGCIFEKNNLISQKNYPNVGIITSYVAGTIDIYESTFSDNLVGTGSTLSEIKAVIYAVEYEPSYSGNQYQTDLSISHSTFTNNRWMNFALIVIGMWDDGRLNESSNYQYNNSLIFESPLNSCCGVGYFALDYYYYDYYPQINESFVNGTCIAEFSKTSFPTLSPSTSSAPSIEPSSSLMPSSVPSPFLQQCWSDNFIQNVMAEEREVTDTSIPRTYKMCPGTTLNIAEFKLGSFEQTNSSVPALSIWNPNINIVCGRGDTNCIFSGGTFHIKLFSLIKNIPILNVLIQGFQFTRCDFKNIIIEGTALGAVRAGITFKDCNFHDNIEVTSIIDIFKHSNTRLTIDNCIFQDNKLKYTESSPNVGLINAAEVVQNSSKKGQTISIFNTHFIRNDIQKNTALVFFGGLPLPEYYYSLHVHGSRFTDNLGMTTSLILGGYLFDSDYTSSNNFAIGNIDSKNTPLLCPGISRIRRKDSDKSYEECLVNFIKTFKPEVTPNPSILLEDTSKSCWSSMFTEKVMDAEELVIDTSIPRTYRMCNDTIIRISSYNYDQSKFNDEEGEIKALSIWNSNVNIVCGDDKNYDNNCTFIGGTFQIEVLERNIPFLKHATVENIRIEGFTFTEASEANFKIYGSDVEKTGRSAPGASVFVKNCRFTENEISTVIWLAKNYNTHLSIDSSTFDNNNLVNSILIPSAGIITSYKASKISIHNTMFKDNVVKRGNFDTGIRAIIYAVEDQPKYSNNQHETDLLITSSSFINNIGMTFALVVNGLWSDGKSTEYNNYQKMNVMDKSFGNFCYGIAHVAMDYVYYESINYYIDGGYYHIYDIIKEFIQCNSEFSDTFSPSSAPSLFPSTSFFPSKEPTLIPTEYPTFLPTFNPTSTFNPTESPSLVPTLFPTSTMNPSVKPTSYPTMTYIPSIAPTVIPTATMSPSLRPTQTPSTTTLPSLVPTMTQHPSIEPTFYPTKSLSVSPTIIPTMTPPTVEPSLTPTKEQTTIPSNAQTIFPTNKSSTSPTKFSTIIYPTKTLSVSPTILPTMTSPTVEPSLTPTKEPTIFPSNAQIILPTKKSSTSPTKSSTITILPTVTPSIIPTSTVSSSLEPTTVSSIKPTFYKTTINSVSPTLPVTITALPTAATVFKSKYPTRCDKIDCNNVPTTPTNSPISSSPGGVCDNGNGYAIDTDGMEVKCGQNRKKLVDYCAKDFFNSVCRKKCGLCTISTSAPILVTSSPSSSSPGGVCDNGNGYAIDTDGMEVKCWQNRKKLVDYCAKDFFNSVCRKKCGLCTISTSAPILVTSSPSSSSPGGVCDNGNGYAIDTDGMEVKCGQNRKKLVDYCAKDFFNSVCRKKCGLCTISTISLEVAIAIYKPTIVPAQ